MLTVIQIIAISQGLFLGVTLFQKKQVYKPIILKLFMGCILSVILFAIGDDDYNLIVEDSNWFPFHEILIATFFFLFVRYSNSNKDTFDPVDSVFFLPYLLYVIFKIAVSSAYFEDNIWLEIGSELAELCLVGMLLYSTYDILKHEKEKWLLAFIVPFTLIFIVDGLTNLFDNAPSILLSLDSYGVFLIAIFLFYFVTYQLVIAPKGILSYTNSKYKTSTLSKKEIKAIQAKLERLMTEEKLFKNQKLNANETAHKIGITRQQLSEVLNVHMNIRFQDLLNQYRVEEFIQYLNEDEYKNFTLLAMATEAGFSSKSSFNATFKKLKGVTPSQYRKQQK